MKAMHTRELSRVTYRRRVARVGSGSPDFPSKVCEEFLLFDIITYKAL